GVLPGDSIQFTYTDRLTNVQHNVTVVRVDDPAALPLSNAATPSPNDRVIGVNFTGGLASIVNQLNSQFNGQVQFANPAGSTLRVMDDGGNNTTFNAASTTVTTPGLMGGSAQLPFFTDVNNLYTGAIT